MKLYCLLLLLFFFSCKNEKASPQTGTDSAIKKIAFSQSTMPDYDVMKAKLKVYKKILQHQSTTKMTAETIARLQKEFVAIVIDSILPYWYGTPWDFNGTTQKPGQGSIACGYFITTVLQDAGVPIQRVKLAQCASQQMIYNLVQQNRTKVFSNATMDGFINYIQQQGFGIYIVGLDSHVGFLYNDGKEVYFIHAKWVNPKAVVKEVASQSGVLYYSAYKIVGKISDDEKFLTRWAGWDK